MASARHALVIEDIPIIAMMIQDQLSDLGFSVAIASTEAQAIELAAKRCPDLILADARLEEGCGVEAVRQICQDRPIPVIFMTGDLDAVRISIGDAVLLEKPFTTGELRFGIATAGPLAIGA